MRLRRDDLETRESAAVTAWMHDVVARVEAADVLSQQPVDVLEHPKRIRPLRAKRTRR